MERAASTDARSNSSPWMIPIAHRNASRRRGGWWSRKRCWRCSARSAPRRRPPCTNISTPRACRSFCSTPAPRKGKTRRNNKWTMAGLPLYPTEARILAKHAVSVNPNAKIGILYQNDDFGRDFLGPFKKVLEDAGGTAKVIMEQTYDLTEPTVDSQLINLSKSGADTFYNITTGKATSQSIRKVVELGWKPLQLL